MAVELEVPVGVGGKPVVVASVENDQRVVANTSLVHKCGEGIRSDEIALERILEIVLPVDAQGARNVTAAVCIGVLVNFEQPGARLAEVRLHPLRFDKHLLIRRDSHRFVPPCAFWQECEKAAFPERSWASPPVLHTTSPHAGEDRAIVQVPMPQMCEVRLVGGFVVEIDGRLVPAEAWRHRRGADLVKRLALAPQHRLHREQLMEDLWPDLGAEAAAANLRKAVFYARRSLASKDAVGAEGEMLSLWPGGPLRIDAEGIDAAAVKALATGESLEVFADLFTGDLLPEDRYVGWIEPHRERLRKRHLEVLKAAGRWEEILVLDRGDESAHRALMQSHLDVGNRQAAIRQFQRLREILRVDLGVAPEPATIALFEQAVALKGREPASPAERAQAVLARGLLQWNQRNLDGAQRLADEVRAVATEHHLGRELGEASSLLGMVAFARGQWPDRFRQEFMDALRLGGDEAPFLMDAHLCLVEASLTGADGQPTARLAHE